MAPRHRRQSFPKCRLVAMAALTCPLLLAGCPHATRPRDSADALLRESLAKCASLKTYKAAVKWTATSVSDKYEAARLIEYTAPNRFLIRADHDNTLQLTSVCDGVQITEYSNVPGMLAGIYPAPSTFGNANSPQLSNPLDCGSPLYAFFSGADGYSHLVDAKAPPPRYGDTIEIDGISCVDVVFTEPNGYGCVTASIGVDDKLVHAIAYDSAGLMAKGATVEVDSAPSSGAPPFLRSLPHDPESFPVTEVYESVSTAAQLADSEFDTRLPDSLPPFKVAQDTSNGSASQPAGDTDIGKPPVPIGSPAPNFAVIDTRTGKKTKLSDLKGKVVVLDFFASWCMPCRFSLPETQKIYSEYSARGLTVMGIDGESRGKINQFMHGSGYTFPAYEDRELSASRAYQANAIPTLAIVDRQERLIFYAVGPQEKATIEDALKKAGA